MEQPFAPQSFQLAPRRSMGTQGGSLVGDHAWETSFGESDRNDRQNTSHFSNPSSPKTIALFLKRSTKQLQRGRIDPVQVFHDKEHGLLGRNAQQRRQEGLEGLLLLLLGSESQGGILG